MLLGQLLRLALRDDDPLGDFGMLHDLRHQFSALGPRLSTLGSPNSRGARRAALESHKVQKLLHSGRNEL